jgi:hypothetical protein
MRRNLFFVGLFIAIAHIVVAQSRPKTGYWLTLQAPIKMAKKIEFFNEIGYRSLGNNLDPFQFFYRNTIKYLINKNVSVGIGGALFNTRTSFNKDKDEYGVEPRLYEELQVNHTFKNNAQLIGRLRVEQRFFQETSIKPGFFSFRYRVRLTATKPITSKTSIQINNEFMHANTKQHWKFDQNRLLTQFVFQLPVDIQLQAGYQWIHYVDKTNQHIAAVTVVKKLSTWKQKP